MAVTVEIFASALENGLGMDREESKKLSTYLMNFFGLDGFCIDNAFLDNERGVLYYLQEHGLVKTERYLANIGRYSKIWIYHYWVLDENKILEYANKKEEEKDSFDVYSQLDDAVWKRS